MRQSTINLFNHVHPVFLWPLLGTMGLSSSCSNAKSVDSVVAEFVDASGDYVRAFCEPCASDDSDRAECEHSPYTEAENKAMAPHRACIVREVEQSSRKNELVDLAICLTLAYRLGADCVRASESCEEAEEGSACPGLEQEVLETAECSKLNIDLDAEEQDPVLDEFYEIDDQCWYGGSDR